MVVIIIIKTGYMFARIFGKKPISQKEELTINAESDTPYHIHTSSPAVIVKTSNSSSNENVLDKCLHNCQRYVYSGQVTCCNSCNGVTDKHSLLCQYAHRKNDLEVKVVMAYYDFVLNVPREHPITVCAFKNIPNRLYDHLTQLIKVKFEPVVNSFYLGNEDDTLLKPGKLHNNHFMYIRGYVVELRKKVHEFILKYVEDNKLTDSVMFDRLTAEKSYNIIYHFDTHTSFDRANRLMSRDLLVFDGKFVDHHVRVV